MRKLVAILVLVILVLGVVAPVQAQGPTDLKPFDPLKEAAKVRLLTTAEGVRWFETTAWCQSGVGCFKSNRVGLRFVEEHDKGGPVSCYTERQQKVLKKGFCYFALLDPLRGGVPFVVVVNPRTLDKRIFKVLPAPEPSPTQTPEPTPTRSPAL